MNLDGVMCGSRQNYLCILTELYVNSRSYVWIYTKLFVYLDVFVELDVIICGSTCNYL